MNRTKRSSMYSNIKRGGRGAQNKKKRSKQQETLEKTRYDKTKLSVLEHQTWWERSSKGNARNNKARQDKAQCTRTSNVEGEELKNEKKYSKQKDTTGGSSVNSNIKRGERGAQIEKKRSKQQAMPRRSSEIRCLEEREIKHLYNKGQTASTYGSLLRPERN